MFLKNKVLYSGISNEKGVELIHTYNLTNTGFVLQRITDGENVGSIYELKDGENENMFAEVLDTTQTNTYMKDKTIIAGVLNEKGFDLCLYKLQNNEALYTGKKFVRIHDGQEMGNVIYLGIDYSYNKKGREDLPQYYLEIDDVIDDSIVEGIE